jgi:uncharacterized membrane protein YqgA involved in biofilm formation
VGAILKRGIKDEYKTVLFDALGLCTVALGANAVAQNLPKSEYPVLFILSMAIGGLIGRIINLDGWVNKKANQRAMKKGQSSTNLVEGLTTGLLLYCIGTFSIVGPMMSALQGDNTYLFTNSTLDIVTSAILAGNYGIGMALAAPVLFLWQGSIYLLTTIAGPIISNELITELSIVGGVLILSSGFSILKIKDCKTVNLLPALLVPPIFFLIKSLF